MNLKIVDLLRESSELENEIDYFKDCIRFYDEYESGPPIISVWEDAIKEREEKLKKLAQEYFKLTDQLSEKEKEELLDEPKKVGRPSLGVTKKVSLTLSEETWAFLDKVMEKNKESRSELLRNLIDLYKYDYFYDN